MRAVEHFIDGKRISGGTQSISVTDPATGNQVASVAVADSRTVNAAVDSATAAHQHWKRTPPHKRAAVLSEFQQLVTDHADELVSVITEEHGKTLLDSRGELQRGIENIEYAIGIAEHLKGEHSRLVGPDIDSWSEHAPVGVCVGITPFNFPVMVPMWMFPLAVACGNSFILKPSEKVPTAGLLVAELFTKAGLPEGVLNVVQGDQSSSRLLLEHPEVKAVSFVGSTPIAKTIYTAASEGGKRVQALGGAKNHAIVLPDADVESACNAIMGAAYGSCGQRCMALSVVISVGKNTATEITRRLKGKINDLNVGAGTGNPDMGPVNSEIQRERILSLIQSGVDEGADLLVDGREHPMYRQPGYYLGGTLFDNVRPGMAIYDEEIFGPVLCHIRVDTAADALQIVNGNQYGNGSCIFTRDGHSARQFADEVDAGMVGINVPLPVPVANHSFGGWKNSRFGDLAAYGPDGVRFYTRRKTITERWHSPTESSEMNFAFPAARSPTTDP
ncbi:MAG: CoA-acylating methylmalonate-semialdehyde dehydrogenase [Gammaproteobacteria bacterium]|jgi:malonate-semialdehyde dehydrogenase (acetylating) / methylmalonate-semialdehyde dehydrogenase|nr:CoA-acylating methylmalonate-semialdehyde dehydrogenase [Gammaproteobacteria bacterium]MBT4492646.1 CoA-acylating methylmalonate-semialdehyde dehydrogenase [Gammaproteobacteria bacterium]